MDQDIGEGEEVIAGWKCKVRREIWDHLVDKGSTNTQQHEDKDRS